MDIDQKKKNITRKEYIKISIALTILVATSFSYYMYVRNEALKVAQHHAEHSLKLTENIIVPILDKVETIVNSMQLVAENSLDDPNTMFEIAQQTVEECPYISGADISFKEYYYPEKGRWFQAYAGYLKNSDTIITKQIGGPNHDYTKMDWFVEGVQKEDGTWSDPYYDNAGGNTHMVTYSRAIWDSTDSIVGIISADIPIESLKNILKTIRPYENSFCTLTTESGENIVSSMKQNNKPLGKCHSFSETIDGKNLVITLTIPDSDMYKQLRRSGLVFVLLSLLGIGAVILIASNFIWNLTELNKARAKEQHIEDELAIARDIQKSLLPQNLSSNFGRYQNVFGFQVPAKYVGGDLYDYYVRENKLLFCIGDVSGKGVPAALLMSIAHSLFRTCSALNDQPELIMKDLNNAISENNPDIMFITMFIGILDLNTGNVRYCNSGHNPPIVIQSGHPEFINTEPSLLMGVKMDALYTAYELTLKPGDTLFMYTDGITEAENIDKELFGEKRVLKTAAKYQETSAQEQIEKMYRAVKNFVGEAEQSDDITMLAVRFTPLKETLTLLNKLTELSKLEPFLNNFFKLRNMSLSDLPQLDLALEEAVTNIILYAYPEGTQGTADIEMSIFNKTVRILLTDSGIPFNPLEYQESDLDVPLKERKIGGLGIHLIKEIMDTVTYEYRSGKNTLLLEKHIAATESSL